MQVFAKLKPFYWPYRWTLLSAIISMGILTALGLIRPYITKLVIDDVITQGKYNELPWLIGGVIGIAAARGIFNYLRQYLGDLFGQKVVFELRTALYEKLQRVSFHFYDFAETGNLMSRLTGDVEAFRQFLSFGVIFFMDFFYMLSFSLVAMWLMSPRLTLASVVLMPFLAVTCWSFDRRIRPAFASIRRTMGTLSTSLQESIAGIRTVKSFANEHLEIDRFSERNNEFASYNITAGDIRSQFLPVIELIGNLGTVILLFYGGSLVINGHLTTGDLVAFFSLISYLVWPIRELGMLINILEQALAGGARLIEILDAPTDVLDPVIEEGLRKGTHLVRTPRRRREIKGRVQFENVSFEYDLQAPETNNEYYRPTREYHQRRPLFGENPVLIREEGPVVHNINLDVSPGSTIAVLGTTGAGKSTLVSLIPRFYDVTEGRVLVDGKDVREWNLFKLRQHVGMVMQDTFLFSASIRENISYGNREASLEAIQEAAKVAQAHEFIMDFPDGYDTVVGERGLGLSGGQRQRVAIARALLIDPSILILDDSTSACDMETERLIQKGMMQVMEGRTTFIIAHRISSLKHADEIIVLDQGRIAERGTHEQLARQQGLYHEIYEVQMAEFRPDAGLPRAVNEGGAKGGS